MVQVKIKKPEAVLFDVSGTTARESFVEKNLVPYFKIAHRAYLENNWSKQECQDCVKKLAEAAEKASPDLKIDVLGDKKETINKLSKYIDSCLENGKETKVFAEFRFLVWFDGYDRGKLSTPVYSDVAVTIQKWKCIQNIKLYVLSNGWAEATRKFMSKTSHGDLNLVIDDHFDTSIGSLLNPETFTKVAQKINQKPNDMVFLTKSLEEGKAAKKAGINVILVLTHSSAVDAVLENCKDIPIVRTFTDITFF